LPKGARADKEVPWALLYLILLRKMLDSLKRLAAVNSFTANRAGVLRNGEIVAAQFHDLGFFEFWMRATDRLSAALLAEPRGGLSDGNYLSQLVPTLGGLGPFGLHGHTSERSVDGSKLPEFVVASSFLEMGAISVAAIRELVSE
jgi:hypothetical protein